MPKNVFRKAMTLLLMMFLFSINLNAQISPPYFNNFDTFDSLGWSHYTINGTDDWVLVKPSKYYFPSSYSLPNAWVTNKTGDFVGNSNRALQTPCFDLSDTTQNLVFSFYHKTHANSSGNTFIIEYSLNNGGAWSMLENPSSPSRNWQNASGFSSFYNGKFYHSAIRIRFLQGNPSVCFRFRFNSAYPNGDGWMIDNFSIAPEYYNIVAVQGDTIRNINRFFTNFTLKFDYLFYNQYSTGFTFSNNFYFSSDKIKDPGDIFLGSKNLTTSDIVSNWTNTFSLPSSLNAGYYYIIYELDASNALVENNESDNFNYSVLKIDSIYNTNFSDHFDTSSGKWNTAFPFGSSVWKQGAPNYFRMEKAHSGNTCYFTNASSGSLLLESPYLDLSHKTNQSICFWYKQTYALGNSKMALKIPLVKSFKTSIPTYSTSIPIGKPRNNNWDCFCYKLSASFDTIISTKFAIAPSALSVDASTSSGIWSYERNGVDDVYIGESKPDVSADFRDGHHFTCSNSTVDTLYYFLFNSGLGQLSSTVSEFYWSSDSILDGSDIIIGTVNEPTISDTISKALKLVFTKPNLTPGTYYIVYKLDAAMAVDEMREYNNTGYVKIVQYSSSALPYFNDFETNTTNWYHFSSLGKDNWVCSTPNKPNITSAFSGNKAWLTSDTGNVSQYSKMHLYTPIFNLNQLNHPVLEFDMKLLNYGVNGYYYWPYNASNMTYSLDGGRTWKVLDTTNLSFARWYEKMEMETINGADRFYINGGGIESSTVISSQDERVFQNYFGYQTRDGLNTTHYVLDLNFLKSQKNILFRFNYVNVNANVDGALIDNFKISEATTDLAINKKKNILAAPSDQFVAAFFDVNNNGNYMSSKTSVKLYLSSDTILDVTDYLLETKSIDAIRPERKFYCNFKKNTTLLSTGIKYLIYEIDPQNLIAEINETNNIGYFLLCGNGAVSLPYFNDFNASEIDGWSTFNDSTGYHHLHRFRTKLVIGDYVFNGNDGEWFLDPIDQKNYNIQLSAYPIHYLLSPTFDFSGSTTYQLEFDFLCIGSYYTGEGANLQYSTDGGASWKVISTLQDNNAVNIYQPTDLVLNLNNQPGWYVKPRSTAKVNLAFLTGLGNVRFRFAFKGKIRISYPGEQGFRLDNFKISVSPNSGVNEIKNEVIPSLIYLNNNNYEILNISECNKALLQVFDIQGKMVSDNTSLFCTDRNKMHLNLSNINPGMYFIHMTDGNKLHVYRVIVM